MKSSRRLPRRLSPEQEAFRAGQYVRKELHRGLDEVIDRNLPAFMTLLDEGYVLVATVSPFREEGTKDGGVGSIPSKLLAPDGTPIPASEVTNGN